MIPDFATRMLPINNMRNTDFSWGKVQQKAFEDIKNEFCAKPLVQPYSFQREATVTTDAFEKTVGGVFFAKKDIQSFIYIEKVDSSKCKTTQTYSGKHWQLCLWSQDWNNSFLEENLPYRRTTNNSNIFLPQTNRSQRQHHLESQDVR